jgi:hypothetical protein
LSSRKEFFETGLKLLGEKCILRFVSPTAKPKNPIFVEVFSAKRRKRTFR